MGCFEQTRVVMVGIKTNRRRSVVLVLDMVGEGYFGATAASIA